MSNGTRPPTALTFVHVGAISAPLLRRLSAAADGHRDGKEHFFTAQLEPDANGDFHIKGPFTAAAAAAIPAVPGRAVFGPYVTKDPPAFVQKPIRKITVELDDNTTFDVDPEKIDALFWSTSAIDKFMVPHYERFSSREVAQRIVIQFLDPSVMMLAHDPNTEPITIPPKPDQLPQAIDKQGLFKALRLLD